MVIFNFFSGIYSPEAMENYKSLDAYRYFISGWVQTIKHVTRNSIFIAKCEVRPSYRRSDNPHVPWVALSPTGSVIAGHCTCTAG